MQRLKVSENKRFLVNEDGSPFFLLGDTAWEMFHRLNKEDAGVYLKNRAKNGFNVALVVALAEFDGVRKPNAYGYLPLRKNSAGEYDPTLPDIRENEYDYWDHVDYVLEEAEKLGIYIGFLPTWGDKYNIGPKGAVNAKFLMAGPEIFTKENAFVYGEWLGKRYKDRKNIFWVLGGDRTLETGTHFDVIRAMAEGIAAGDGGEHLITFHPRGGMSSAQQVHNEPWLDFNMIQSGHGNLNRANYEKVEDDYNKKPIKPTMDAEPRYEDHPIGFAAQNGYFDSFDVRQAAYWAVFAGAFGHTYGHHSVWGMTTEQTDYFVMQWTDALDRPGATQMKYLKELIESRPFLERIPDQGLLAENYVGANYIAATRGENYAFFYSPNGLKIKTNMGILKGSRVKSAWFDPRTGETKAAKEHENTGVCEFMPPTSGRGDDWVLILDSI